MLKNNVGYTAEQLLERVTKQKAREERQAAAAGKQEAESSRVKRHKQLSAICHKKQVCRSEKQNLVLRTPCAGKTNCLQSVAVTEGRACLPLELLSGEFHASVCFAPVSYTHLTLPTIYSV